MDTKTANVFSKFPPDFQEDFFKKIAQIVKRGDSIQITGAPGAGSSLLLNILNQTPSVKEKYFGKNNSFVFILFDEESLLEISSVSAARLLLSKLDPVFSNVDESGVLSRLEERVNQLCGEKRLVLMIDHLHKLNLEVLQRFFANLYKLFRNNEANFSFIFTTDRQLTIENGLDNFGLLSRCVAGNCLIIPPLRWDDSLWFIKEKEKQLNIALTSSEEIKIFNLAGGFPRTMRRIVEALGKGIKLGEIEANPSMDANLGEHLNELTGYKEVLGEMPILETYQGRKTSLNSESINGILFKVKLTRNEEKVLNFLLGRKNEIQKREAVIGHVWGEKALGVSDHAYDQIIHRLKNKSRGSAPKVTIETIRGRGHLLTVDK